MLVIHAICMVGAVMLGTTSIPVPWASWNSAGFIPFNFVFSIALVSSVVVFWESPLSILEESSHQSWVVCDWLFLMVCLVECVVVALLGNGGMLQYTLISLAVLFVVCFLTTMRGAFYTLLLITAAQCILISVLPSRYLPVFWPVKTNVIVFVGILAVVLFALVRSSMKKGYSLFG
ncbi:hypothetical protein ACEN2D_07435 [Corynebacterium auriscanis]|uniref:hypothetical protein n=1 Tax=Corynebacterium auriscanis TaxID=99807 RepID=UPI003CF630B3